MKAAIYFIDDQIRQSFFALVSGKAEEQEIHDELAKAYTAIANDAFLWNPGPQTIDPEILSHDVWHR
jgi:hypothetical protein